MTLLQDRDRDGRISYAEFCGKKTINEKAFEVPPFHQMAFDLEIISKFVQSDIYIISLNIKKEL